MKNDKKFLVMGNTFRIIEAESMKDAIIKFKKDNKDSYICIIDEVEQ